MDKISVEGELKVYENIDGWASSEVYIDESSLDEILHRLFEVDALFGPEQTERELGRVRLTIERLSPTPTDTQSNP